MNEEGVQQLPSHVAIYCYINIGWKIEECILVSSRQPADCNYACTQTTLTNCYGSMTQCDCKPVTEVYYNMIKVCRKKVGGGDKEPQITEGRAVNIA